MDGPNAEKFCLSIRSQIAERIGPNRFRTWFGESAQFRVQDHALDVVVSNEFVGSWIAANYLDDLREVTRGVLGEEDVAVRVITGEPHVQPASREGDWPLAGASPTAPPLPRNGRPAPALRGRLGAFVVGPSNHLAYSAAADLAQSPGRAFRLLVIHGGCGLGKTHLLHGVCNGLAERHPTLAWRYVSGEEFTNEFVYAVKAGRVDLFRARFRHVDVLAIDDVHFLANKRATQEEFLHTFNAIDAGGKAVVLSSDQHPSRIATLSEPLVNRLLSGMIVEIEPPDVDMRREILRRRAASMPQPAPDEVLDLIAQRVTRNVRELEGALLKVAAVASLTREPLTLETVEKVLRHQFARETRRPEAADIVAAVAARLSVTREQIYSRSRDRTVSLARAIAMYLIRRHTLMSFPEIGRAIGHKNHSTVVMATQRIERMLHNGEMAAWRTPSGAHQTCLRGLIEALEHELIASPA